MTKHYRFISNKEWQELHENGFIRNKNSRPLFLLPEKPLAKVVPESTNYNLTMEEFFNSTYPVFDKLSKECFLSYLIGTVSSDYLLELDLDETPSMYNLGWYGFDEKLELCVLETCISRYNAHNIKKVYKGDFYDWQNITEITM